MFDYIRDPAEIQRKSFERVRAETDLDGLSSADADVAVRLVHACGMPGIVGDLVFGGDAAAAGRRALKAGATVLVDVEMVGAGIIRGNLSAANRVVCTLNDGAAASLAAETGTTRSAAAVELWRNRMAGAVVAIGNAPTALYRLLELIGEGAEPPAMIAAFPVGFVGAADSKDALIAEAGGTPFITLRGRLGGSAMAAACVNALAGGHRGGEEDR